MAKEILKTLDDMHFNNKVVLLRVDFNVPMQSGVIQDDKRIQAHLPTIKELSEKGARIILMSHLGNPETADDPNCDLAPIANRLSDLLGMPIAMAKSHSGPDVAFKTKSMKSGDIMMLPNLRFEPTEMINDASFGHRLSSLADIYINDAFGASHREHSSIVAVTTFFKERAIGRLMQKEIEMLDKIVQDPDKPMTFIVGGAKASTKLIVMKNLLENADNMLVAGVLANTILAAKHIKTGASLVERDQIKMAEDIIHWAERDHCNLHLPLDVVVADKMEAPTYTEVKDVEDVGPADIILDIGPKTVAKWADIIQTSNTVLWNGPCGLFEQQPFDKGTIGVANAIANSGAFSICGGGDTLSAFKAAGVREGFDYLSTGGGALLEYLKGNSLPGIKSLSYGTKSDEATLSQKNFNRFVK